MLILCIPIFSFAEEVQIGFYEKPDIQQIDAALEKKLALFPEYKNFIEARLYKIDSGVYLLEILHMENGTTVRKKLTLDENAYQALRQKISAALIRVNTDKPIDQEGRYTLLTATTLLSLGMYGPLMVPIADIDQSRNIAAVESVTGSAGFFIPFWLTYDRQVSESSAFSYIYGSLIGSYHGLLSSLLMYGNDLGPPRISASMTMGLSLAEGVGCFFLTDRLHPSLGKVDTMAWGSVWGSVWALETAGLTTDMESGRMVGGALLAGSLGGIGLGYVLSETEHYTRGDAIVQNDVVMLGTYIPLAIVDMTGTDKPKVFLGASLAGSLAGTALGYMMIKDKNFTTGQGGLISLGEFAGALLGTGAAAYFSYNNGTAYLVWSAAGGTIGYAVMYYIFKDSAAAFHDDRAWNIRILPYGIAGLIHPQNDLSGAGALRKPLSASVPLVSLEYRFD